MTSMNLVSPQVFILEINAVQEQSLVYANHDGDKQVGIRKVLPFTLTFDHRAINFNDVLPFIKTLASIFSMENSPF